MIKAVLLLLLLAAAYAQTGSIQVTPTTSTLWAQSSYAVNFYTFFPMPSTSTITLNFSATYITIPSGSLNTSAVVNGVSVPAATASCSGNICTLKLNKNVASGTSIQFTIGNFTNPYFLRAQPITANVTYNASYTEYPSWTIPVDRYTPMTITSNSLTQSDYGVGNTGVSYVFNFSLPMSPPTVQLSLALPPQVTVGTLQISLVYYGAVQYAIPVTVNNIIVLTFTAPVNATTSYAILNVSGLVNPQSMGNSSSFVMQILLPTLPGTLTTCSNCAVAQITSSLFAQSTVPGNIHTINMFSSNSLIGQQNSITIYSKLYASIPAGGIYQILLPPSVKPVLPVSCSPLYGFTLTSGSASCSYNSTNNAIYTNNFVFSGSGSVVLSVTIINPPDTTMASFYFQSFDSASNMIGSSASAYNITATPLPLNTTAVKTNSQVESPYRLTIICTLGVALTSSNTIQVILPQAAYNTSNIVCMVGAAVPCTTSIDSMTQNLTITLSPPCSPCLVGTSFSFAIDGLTNPSFINGYSQSVIIQSATTTGIIETNSLKLSLFPSTLTIGNYTRSGSNSVGSTYSMSFNYTVSSYINTNGGMLLINFNHLDTFINPVVTSDGSYDYPVTIAVTDPLGNQYTNSLTYYATSTPNALQEIAINICGGSNCAGSVTIAGLRKGFNPLSSLTQSIQITTVFGDSVSTSTFNIMQFNVAKASKPLALSLTNSITTLSSNYVLDFVSASVPFQSGLSFSLSSLHTINGGCFLTHNGSIFNGAFTCQVQNSTSVSLSYSGDPTLMMLETIDYTVSIINVTNPISVVPLTYQLATQFSSTANMQFTLTYAIQTALPLNLLSAKSNNTFGQSAVLNMTIVSKYPSFNEIKINAGSALMTVLSATSSSTSYQSAMVNNAYQISQIYSLSNQSVLLNIVNPNNCAISGSLTFSMYNAGYLSAAGSIPIANVTPMFMGLSTATASRTVGDATNLTVTFLRVNSYSSQSQYRLNISSSLYDYSAALYNNSPVAFPIVVPIGLTTVTITNLRNLLYVPLAAPANGIVAWTVDGASAIVALTSYSTASLVPNTPATAIGSSFTRTNTVINGVGAITINYTPRFPTSSSIMTISLPLSQSALVSPACSMQGATNSASSCSVLSSNSTSITLKFYNQTSTTLTNVVNVEPNSNQMKVTMLTSNNQLVETATATVTPSIQYNQLTLSGNVSTSLVATATQLQLTISSPSPIDIGSKIVINFPSSTFSRASALPSQDCAYVIAGVNYTGCAYAQQGAWLSQVNLTALGAVQLPANTAIVLTVYGMNAWSVTPFAALGLTILVSNPSDSIVAQGSISLATIYGGVPSLTASTVGSPTFSQTSTQSNTNNSLTVSFTLGIPLATGSTLKLWLPKSAYTLSASNSALIPNLQSQTQNSTYYAITVAVACSQTAPLCNLAGNMYTLTAPLQNNQYSQIQNSPIAFQVQLGGNPVSTQPSLPLQSFTAQPLSASSASLSRSNTNAFANTNVTITIPNPSTVSSFTLMVSPLIKSTGALPLITSPTFAGVGSSQSFAYLLNSTNFLLINVSGAAGASSSITVSGQNSLLVSASPQSYQLTVMDANFVYFSGQVTPADTLIPYSSGLSLQRIVTTVGKSTSIYLYGTLPTAVSALSVAFNGNSYTVSGSTFNISLGTMVNNNNVSDASTYPIAIKSTDFTAFSSKLPIAPSLTTQNLTALLGISLPAVVNVSSSFNLTVALTSSALTFLSIKTPPYFNSLTKCCIDSACAQTFIQSCTFTAQSGNNVIQLWLSSSQLLSNVFFQVTALDYQQTFTNQKVTVVSALPTSSITVDSALTIAAVNISSSLSLLSWKVNALNTYTLSIQPIAKAGYLQIALPFFLSSQLAANSNNCSYSLTVNGSVTAATLATQNGISTLTLPVTPPTAKLLLLMTSISNPPDNTPNAISITQSSDLALTNVYGYSSLGFSMNQFDLITLTSAIRLVTKVNVATSLILQATVPYASNQFILTFPPSQLLTTSSCSITANEDTALPCQVINSSSILTSSLSGSNRYTITGLQNQKYYNANSTQDQLSAQIGSPYTRATSLASSSTSVSPRLTLGSIVVNSMASSSLVMLASTKLTYDITIENTNNINGFMLMFSTPYYYIFSPTIACSINSAAVPCWAIDDKTLFLAFANPPTSNLIVTISNIVNFVQPTDWTFKSVQTIVTGAVTSYSDVDLYYNDGTSMSHLQSSPLAMRIILPFNYVQSSPVTFQAIIDSPFGSFLPLKLFSFNFTTQASSCQALGSPFSSTLSLACAFPHSTNYNMKLQLYHTKFPAVPLAVGAANMFIYPTPGGGCSNQMCDSCSTANGQEYCFVCRQGTYSSNGECSGSCASGSFPYSSTNICQPCSPTCSNCFGLYDSNCLSCSNTSLALNSGTCVNNCPLPTYSYNGFCVTSEECTGAAGCRLCSDTGFCYQCLPDYTGAPICRYVNFMPPTIMVYFLAPLALLAIISIIIAAAKCVGAQSLLSQTIFSFSMVELFAWAFTVPIMPNVMTAMVLVAFFTLRIIISIVSYEVFYKKNMGELSQKLLEEESQKEIESQEKKEEAEGSHLHNWKTKLVRLTAHFNGPDSYELLKCRIAEPVLIVSTSLAIDAIFMANRWVVCFLMFYMASVGTVGDSVLMPIAVISTAALLSVCRLLTWEKLRKCLSSCRS